MSFAATADNVAEERKAFAPEGLPPLKACERGTSPAGISALYSTPGEGETQDEKAALESYLTDHKDLGVAAADFEFVGGAAVIESVEGTADALALFQEIAPDYWVVGNYLTCLPDAPEAK